MNPNQQIRIAVAEAMGRMKWSTGLPIKTIHCDVPDYPADLNACAEFEVTLSEYDRVRYYRALRSLILPECEKRGMPDFIANRILSATALQRCVAFLSIKNESKE
jgi:hypothetical protein